MIDLLIQHLLNRNADYAEISHRMQTASSKQDRVSAQLISSLAVEYNFNYAYLCLVIFFNIASNLDCKPF